MARCANCNKACQCSMADDGFFPIEVGEGVFVIDLIPGTRTGRRSTVVQGQGTLTNPYTVSFIDSDFYQANGFEYRVTTGIPGELETPLFDVSAVRYTVFPYQMRLDIPLPIGSEHGAGQINVSSGNNLICGFYASLNTGGISGSVTCIMNFESLIPDGGPVVVCADNTVRANPALASMGFVSPLRGLDVASSGNVGLLTLLIDAYGATPVINDCRLWAAWV